MNNKIQTIINQSDLEENKVELLMKSFGGYFETARELAEKSKSIIVTKEDDVAGMNLARETRLKLRSIRVSMDKKRKLLKAQALRENRAIDGISNVIKALIVPVEEHLEKQEKFLEILQSERREKALQKRLLNLYPYSENSQEIDREIVKDMDDSVFDVYFRGVKKTHESKIEAEKKAKQQRIVQERKESIFQKRRYALAEYREFIDGVLDINTTNDNYNRMLKQAKKAKEAYYTEQKRIREENKKLKERNNRVAKKIEEERKRAKEIELKLRKKEIEEEKKALEKKRLLENERKLKEEKERRALLAPDKEKLLKVSMDIEMIQWPALKSKEAQGICEETIKELQTTIERLRTNIKKL